MRTKRDLTERLRDQIVSAIHVGHLRGGDRLPSIRQVSREMGTDARAVARAYRELEAEGLVEVRERAGIYAAPQARVGGVLLEETAQWAARMLVEALKRDITIPDLPDFIHRCTTARQMRCAFVEASEDVITAFTHDLRACFGLDARPVWLSSPSRGSRRAGARTETIHPDLQAADLVMTTAYHARDVGPLAKSLNKPMIAATVNPTMVAAVERQLRNGSLTVICADPRFAQRVRVQYAHLDPGEERIRVIHVDDAPAIAALDSAEPVLLTRAARQRIGRVDLPLVFPHSPTISSSSALELTEFIIRFNLDAE